jgi:hypothetical protein
MSTLFVALSDLVATATGGRRGGGRRSVSAGLVGVVLLCCLSSQAASAAGGFRASRVEPPTRVCRPASPGHAECPAVRVPWVSADSPDAVGGAFEGSGEGGGYTPAEIRAAYKIPGTGGSGQTVALIDADRDPEAYKNLTTYRARYGLPECTEESGCFKEVNQKGQTKNYPENNTEWGYEISVDLDMLSAACPECKILLVEAENNAVLHLSEAVTEAYNLGANVISNSWNSAETKEFEKDWAEWGAKYISHPSVPITADSGDNGYGVSFPASTPYVIAVGGTALRSEPKSERGWVEEVWHGTGSGCALKVEKKPSWQLDTGCSFRTDNDVAAVASTSTPVSFYDTYGYKGWENVGGTSVGAPIVAGVEALAETSVKELGAKIFYEKPGHEFEVTKGNNGTCTPEYLCTAGKGYNGPAGMGALDGVPTLGAAVTTGSAKGITEKEATVSGEVNPEGVATNYYFEYGPTERYGEKTVETSAGSGTGFVKVSKAILGLKANTKYYYRIVATNSGGTTDVSGQVFCTHWCLQETPLSEGIGLLNALKGVSCTSPTECVAVGEFRSIKGGKEVGWALAARWNGMEWSIQEPPTPAGAKNNELNGVSCTSFNQCAAVGYVENSSEKFVPVAEKWNGTVWTAQEPPNPGVKEGVLWGVSCTASTACTAVGRFVSSEKWVPLAERWNGMAWSAQEPPIPTGAKESTLNGASCTSSTMCTAAGYFENSSGKAVPLAEKWNGTAWSVQELPNPAGAKEGYLEGVSCASSTECTAVGEFENSSSTYLSLGERYQY